MYKVTLLPKEIEYLEKLLHLDYNSASDYLAEVSPLKCPQTSRNIIKEMTLNIRIQQALEEKE